MKHLPTKKITNIKLFVFVAAILLATAFTHAVPQTPPPSNPPLGNTDTPVNTSSTSQVKGSEGNSGLPCDNNIDDDSNGKVDDNCTGGGLSVNAFSALGNSEIGKRAIFSGPVYGNQANVLAIGSDKAGITTHAITSGSTISNSLSADNVKASSGLKPLCADASGTIILCPNTPPPPPSAKPKEYSTAVGGQEIVENYAAGNDRVQLADCAKCVTFAISLDTSKVITNTLSGFTPTRLEQGRVPWYTSLAEWWKSSANTYPLWTVPETGTYSITFSSQGYMAFYIKQKSSQANVDVGYWLKVNDKLVSLPVPLADNCLWDSVNMVYRLNGCDRGHSRDFTATRNYNLQYNQTLTLNAGDQVSFVGRGYGQVYRENALSGPGSCADCLDFKLTIHPNQTTFTVKKL